MKEFSELQNVWNSKGKSWIQNEITTEMVDWSKEFGEYLANKSFTPKLEPLTTSQLRKFFGELRRIDSDFEDKKVDLIMMKPILAYAVGRDKGTKIKYFANIISLAIDYVNNKNSFKNFVKVFESIVAYHKYFGGK